MPAGKVGVSGAQWKCGGWGTVPIITERLGAAALSRSTGDKSDVAGIFSWHRAGAPWGLQGTVAIGLSWGSCRGHLVKPRHARG